MYLGIDIGGTYIKYAYIDDTFHIQRVWKKETMDFKDKNGFYDELCKGLNTENISLIGISVPGIVDDITGALLSKAAKKIEVLKGTIPAQEIEKRLKRPAKALNDGKAAGYCEVRMGNGKNTASSAYWIIGTGIGGCLCKGTEIITGANGLAGEFSHIPIRRTDGIWDVLGENASAGALSRIYNIRYKKSKKPPVQTAEEVVALSRKGDAAAINAVHEWIHYQVQGLQILVSIYNPEVICIGGAISHDESLIACIRQAFVEADYWFSDILTTRIEKCQYGSNANLLGATMYAAKSGNKEDIY
mgnify:CR=1 FL=1